MNMEYALTCKLYYDNEWEEYVLRLFADKVYVPGADYCTEDYQDATGTASLMLEVERLPYAEPGDEEAQHIHGDELQRYRIFLAGESSEEFVEEFCR